VYSVYFIAQAVNKYIVFSDNDELHLGAAGIAPTGRTDPSFVDRFGSYSLRCASGITKGFLIETNLILRCLLRDIIGRSNTSKTEVICSGIDFTFAARPNDVTRAVLIVAKE
jgi:hypothetical protein